jgi:hypothetical protein
MSTAFSRRLAARVARRRRVGGRRAGGRIAGSRRGSGRVGGHTPQQGPTGELRYFAGLSLEEAAAVLGVSRATASRYWNFARAWLISALDKKVE